MASPFDQMAQSLYQGFRGKLWSLSLRKPNNTATTAKDDYGDPIDPVPQDYSGEGFVDDYSDMVRAVANIPQTVAKVCIMAGSLDQGVKPERGDMVLIKSKWYRLGKCDTDPATALWECQGSEIPAPE